MSTRGRKEVDLTETIEMNREGSDGKLVGFTYQIADGVLTYLQFRYQGFDLPAPITAQPTCIYDKKTCQVQVRFNKTTDGWTTDGNYMFEAELSYADHEDALKKRHTKDSKKLEIDFPIDQFDFQKKNGGKSLSVNVRVKNDKGHLSAPSPYCSITFKDLNKTQGLTINQGTVSWTECSDCQSYTGFWGIYARPDTESLISLDRKQVTFTMLGLINGERYRFCIKSQDCHASFKPYSCVDEVAVSGVIENMHLKSVESDVKIGRYFAQPKKVQPGITKPLFIARQEYCDWIGLKFCKHRSLSLIKMTFRKPCKSVKGTIPFMQKRKIVSGKKSGPRPCNEIKFDGPPRNITWYR